MFTKKYKKPKVKVIPLVQKPNPLLRCGGGSLCNEAKK